MNQIEKYTFIFVMSLYILCSLCVVLYIAFVWDINILAKIFLSIFAVLYFHRGF